MTKRRGMTGTDRDYEAEKRLREARDKDGQITDRIRLPRKGSHHDQLEELAAATSDGTPNAEADDIDTGMTDMIAASPAAASLWHKIEREKRRRADSILRAMGDKPPAEQMSALEKTIRRLRVLIIAVAIPAGSSAILVGKYLYTKGAEDERIEIERQHQSEVLDQLEKDARAALDGANRNQQRIDDMQREIEHRRELQPKVIP